MTPDQTRARILKAADGLFGTLGFDATTTRDIAERSGVNKALIHYHYGSKDELLSELLDGYYARLGEALTPALTGGGAVRAQMEAVLDAYGDFLAGNLTFCRIVQREVASGRHMERMEEQESVGELLGLLRGEGAAASYLEHEGEKDHDRKDQDDRHEVGEVDPQLSSRSRRG